jgi:hypothetical protein
MVRARRSSLSEYRTVIKLKSFVAPLALSCALLGMGSAQAALTPFTDRAAFLTALGAAAQTDSFDGVGVGNAGTSLARSAGSTAYTASSGGDLWGLASGVDGWLSTYTSNDSILLAGFGSGMFGVGAYFFGTDVDGQLVTTDGHSNVQVTVLAIDGDGAASNFIVPLDTQGFLGFVSSSKDISEVQISIQFTGESYLTINDLILAQDPSADEVPEPASLALVAGALALLRLSGRGKRA